MPYKILPRINSVNDEKNMPKPNTTAPTNKQELNMKYNTFGPTLLRKKST